MARTALPQYQRLEAVGLWRETGGAQRREVIVSFGAASLVLSDVRGTPLTHWSLAAVRRRGREGEAVLYAPDADSEETLEIDDETMNDAIARVQAALRSGRPHPGRVRWALAGLTLAMAIVLTVFWLPGVAADYAARVMPPAAAEEVGARLMEHAERMVGPPCAAPEATDALDRFERWLLPEGYRVHVVDLGAKFSARLPDGQILLNRALIEEYAGPEVAAGFVLAELAAMRAEDPMRSLFRRAGLRATLGYLAGGALPEEAMADFVRERLTAPLALPDARRLSAEFARAGLAIGPFARAVDPSGQRLKRLVDEDPVRETYRPGIDDSDWVMLQGLCGDG